MKLNMITIATLGVTFVAAAPVAPPAYAMGNATTTGRRPCFPPEPWCGSTMALNGKSAGKPRNGEEDEAVRPKEDDEKVFLYPYGCDGQGS